jgi:hypothetical protein
MLCTSIAKDLKMKETLLAPFHKPPAGVTFAQTSHVLPNTVLIKYIYSEVGCLRFSRDDWRHCKYKYCLCIWFFTHNHIWSL